MSDPSVIATYRVETPLSVERAAAVIAGEQSSGTFVSVPGETEALKARSRARVVDIRYLDVVDRPSLPGGQLPDSNLPHATPPSDSTAGDSHADCGHRKYQRAEIKIEFPYDNVGANLPTWMATLCGNLYELSDHTGCKLCDVDFPTQLADRYPGPRHGVAGTRRLTGVANRPIIGTIIKPSVGLSPDDTALLVRQLGEAGIDFIKDDELMADPPHCPLKERVDRVMREIDQLAERTRRKIMYAVNITDELDAMKRHYEHVVQAGGTCVMVSLNHVGYAGVSHLRQYCELPIHGHRNGWGMWTRHPMLGIEFTAWQKVWRAIGVDHLHVNGLRNKFWEPDESVVRSVRALRSPLWGGYHAMPVIASGQWAGQAPETYRLTGTNDLLYVAGGGIMAHPSGPAAGVRSIQQAWEAASTGVSLQEYATGHSELRDALRYFGGRS